MQEAPAAAVPQVQVPVLAGHALPLSVLALQLAQDIANGRQEAPVAAVPQVQVQVLA